MNQLQLYFETRERRLKLQREADTLEQQEKDILYDLTKACTEDKVEIVHGEFHLKAVRKESPLVTNWADTLAYIKETGSIDMLQKRLTDSAVKARWDNGVEIPGITHAFKYATTVTKE